MTHTLSQEAKKEINALMESIDILRLIYMQENEALDASNSRAFMSLQDEKLLAADTYKKQMKQVLKRKDELKKADPALKTKLKLMQADFAGLTEKNLQGLERMRRAGEKFSGRLRFAAKEAARQKGVFSYGQNGAVVSSSKKVPVSMGVSETA